MRKATAELILKDPDRFAHHDRVFLNNPVVMQGMGLAPLVVLATTAHNGVMLAAAVTLLLVWLRKARPWQWMAVGGVGALALVAMAARVLAG